MPLPRDGQAAACSMPKSKRIFYSNVFSILISCNFQLELLVYQMVNEAAANLLSNNSIQAIFRTTQSTDQREKFDLASNAVFLPYHSYLSAIRSTNPTEVPSQRIGETRCTDLASGKAFTVILPGLKATGRVSQRREWLLLGTFTREADGEEERFGKRELKLKRGRGRGRKAVLSVELKPV
ncbi:hypothetical protein EAF00_002959 [Botryotinia globosa]|nr:hypothetical protein EAF00_002959 [Botryotinia globosa]